MQHTRLPTLRVAIVGAGMIGRAHARAFRALRAAFQPAAADVDLCVVADADAGLARDAQMRWEIARVASSWHEVANADDDDDVEPARAIVTPAERMLAA